MTFLTESILRDHSVTVSGTVHVNGGDLDLFRRDETFLSLFPAQKFESHCAHILVYSNIQGRIWSERVTRTPFFVRSILFTNPTYFPFPTRL